MTEKVLPGSSREALSFIAAHWRELLKMSVLPFGIYAATAAFQLHSMAEVYRNLGEMLPGSNPGADFMAAYMRNMALSMVVSLLGACLFGMLFVQIVRFHKTGVSGWFLHDKAGITAGLMTIVYGIGISLLTLVAYVAGIFVIMIPMAILGAIFGNGTAGGAIIAFFAVCAVLALVAGLCWFMCRFIVGLPGVAQGSSPDFFKDMWPLARGESWGVPLRMMLATVTADVLILPILAVFVAPAWLHMMASLPEQNSDNGAAIFPLMADMMDQMVPATAVAMIVSVPFVWFTSLLLTIAFQRFRAREQAA